MQIITTPDGTKFTREVQGYRDSPKGLPRGWRVDLKPYMPCATCPAKDAHHCSTVAQYCAPRTPDKRVFFIIKRA